MPPVEESIKIPDEVKESTRDSRCLDVKNPIEQCQTVPENESPQLLRLVS